MSQEVAEVAEELDLRRTLELRIAIRTLDMDNLLVSCTSIRKQWLRIKESMSHLQLHTQEDYSAFRIADIGPKIHFDY